MIVSRLLKILVDISVDQLSSAINSLVLVIQHHFLYYFMFYRLLWCKIVVFTICVHVSLKVWIDIVLPHLHPPFLYSLNVSLVYQ